MAAQQIHAIVLSGGSAYGLDTANGVMEYLEEQGYGYDTGYALVPLVAQADIYDLSVGDPHVRPDANMGYEAAKKPLRNPELQGWELRSRLRGNGRKDRRYGYLYENRNRKLCPADR